MRVNVRLIDAETGNHLWAERFDKPLADLFDMQDEIVARLANAPFSVEALAVEAEARPLPPGGRFPSEAAIRSWLASPARETFKAMLFAA